MSLLQKAEGQAGSKATNSNDREGDTKRHVCATRSATDPGESERLSGTIANRNATENCSSLMAPSLADHGSKNATKKSSSPPGAGAVQSSLFRLDGDDVFRASDHTHQKQESPMSNKFASIPIGNTNSPNHGAPVAPRRSSDPYLYRDTAGHVHVARHDGSTDHLLHAGATNLIRLEKESERTSRTTRRSYGFEGVVLECLTLGTFDEGMDSDLTKSDEDCPNDPTHTHIERRKSSASPSSRRNSRELSKGSPHIKARRGHRPQGKGDSPREDAPPISPSEVRRSRMLSEDSSKFERSGSPSTTRMSVGTGGTRFLSSQSKGLGSSPGYLSGRGEGRWSVTSGTREDSLDEMLKTPRRSHNDNMLRRTNENLPGKHKERDDSTKISVAKDNSDKFKSPAPQSASWNDVHDNRAPSTTRPTPSPATDPLNRLRESIQALECPPPL